MTALRPERALGISWRPRFRTPAGVPDAPQTGASCHTKLCLAPRPGRRAIMTGLPAVAPMHIYTSLPSAQGTGFSQPRACAESLWFQPAPNLCRCAWIAPPANFRRASGAPNPSSQEATSALRNSSIGMLDPAEDRIAHRSCAVRERFLLNPHCAKDAQVYIRHPRLALPPIAAVL